MVYFSRGVGLGTKSSAWRERGRTIHSTRPPIRTIRPPIPVAAPTGKFAPVLGRDFEGSEDVGELDELGSDDPSSVEYVSPLDEGELFGQES